MDDSSTKRASKSPPALRCADVLKLRPRTIDESLIRRLIGKRVARTLTEVAAEFDVEPTTLRANWRQQGMPGRAGSWPLADILIWRLRHEAATADRQEQQRPNEHLKARSAEIELQLLELDLLAKERREEAAAGQLIDRPSAVAATRRVFAMLTEQLMTIPIEFSSQWPLDRAVEWQQDLEQRIRRALTWASEGCNRVVQPDPEPGDDDGA